MREYAMRTVVIVCVTVLLVVGMVLTAITLSGMRTERIELQCYSQGGHWEKVNGADFLTCVGEWRTVGR